MLITFLTEENFKKIYALSCQEHHHVSLGVFEVSGVTAVSELRLADKHFSSRLLYPPQSVAHVSNADGYNGSSDRSEHEWICL